MSLRTEEKKKKKLHAMIGAIVKTTEVLISLGRIGPKKSPQTRRLVGRIESEYNSPKIRQNRHKSGTQRGRTSPNETNRGNTDPLPTALTVGWTKSYLEIYGSSKPEGIGGTDADTSPPPGSDNSNTLKTQGRKLCMDLRFHQSVRSEIELS